MTIDSRSHVGFPALSRRAALAMGLGAVAGGLAAQPSGPARVRSGRDDRAPRPMNASYQFRVGDADVMIVADGNLRLGDPHPLMGREAPAEAVRAEVDRGTGRPGTPVIAQCNSLVVRHGGRTLLVDTGCGTAAGPQAGALVEHLAAAGVALASVDLVFITHLHFDHVSGLTDDGGTLRYPNARYTMAREEHDFWARATPADLQGMAADDERRAGMIAGARAAIDAMKGSLTLVGDGEPLLGPAAASSMFGHTPGHTGVRITSDDLTLHYVGDALVHPVVSFRRPEWSFAFDAQPERASATRRALLGRLAASEGRELLASTHIGFPGLGAVTREGASFNYHPLAWDWARG